MIIWHASVLRILRESGLFSSVQLTGGKVRALLSQTRFLDIYIDPTTNSYSYAVIDLTLPQSGDKRLFGWDDFPHPDFTALTDLSSYPHHYQERLASGEWRFHESAFRGNVDQEVHKVIQVIKEKLFSDKK